MSKNWIVKGDYITIGGDILPVTSFKCAEVIKVNKDNGDIVYRLKVCFNVNDITWRLGMFKSKVEAESYSRQFFNDLSKNTDYNFETIAI